MLKNGNFTKKLLPEEALVLTFARHGVVPSDSLWAVEPEHTLVAVHSFCVVSAVQAATASFVITVDVQRQPINENILVVDAFVRTTEAVAR